MVRSIKAKIFWLGYPIAKLYWFVARPSSRGVKCLVVNKGRILLVRHTYGPSLLTTVGGGIKRNESAYDAVLREVKEEAGLQLARCTKIGDVQWHEEYKNDHVQVFVAESIEEELVIDKSEIVEANWYGLDNLPADTSDLFKAIFDLAKPYLPGELEGMKGVTPPVLDMAKQMQAEGRLG